MHEYPLSIVDHFGFRKFVNGLQPLFKMVTRNTIKSDIFKIYELEKDKTIFILEYFSYRISLTTDM
ncbi:Putative AC transposase [Apostasia shenzhenica]|uniref:AC transposase n=1 Tax=Apostasia shenzhenica TaxID=1088818 RepID=A0A2I0ALI9_9ASPA|nr:Putative AC transposase [Apostasia shenzhenica]